MGVTIEHDLGELDAPVSDRINRVRADRWIERFWSRDPSLWGGTPETPELRDRLGWLDLFDATAIQLTRDLARYGSQHSAVVLGGMGGSSLAPHVMASMVAASPGSPPLRLLDSTAAAAVASLSVERAAFVASSKSGGTLESTSFLEYFWETAGGNADRVSLITDPGSSWEAWGSQRGVRRVFAGIPDVGGRFSGLSVFGLVPVAMAGLPALDILETGSRAASAAREQDPEANRAAWLGAAIGEAAVRGKDKLTLVLSDRMRPFALWVEQMVAESTGKAGRGILPVVAPLGSNPSSWGADRIVVSLRFADEPSPSVLAAATRAGHPAIRIVLDRPEEIGGELFRWEFATAVASAVIGVNPFDQPNVAESKYNTQAVLSGGLLSAIPFAASEALHRLLDGVQKGHYVAILAYIAPTVAAAAELDTVAGRLESRLGVAVTWGFGPRYLHSTGQYHKGGPAIGHFIQIVEIADADIPIPRGGGGGGDPDGAYTFNQVFAAQADGDYLALAQRNRPIVRLAGFDALRAGIA